MKEILADLDRWQSAGDEIAVATLVRVEGSAPRPPGARLAVTRGGGMAGSVSGGCVESDVYERAMQVLDAGQPALAAYGIDDEQALDVGLSCGGTIHVLIEPFAADEAWKAARKRVEAQQPVVLATAVSPEALRGRRLAALPDGGIVGGIDPALDGEIADEARRLLLEGSSGVIALSSALASSNAEVFVESFAPPARLYIVGATHIAMPLSRMAGELGFAVTVIDARGLFATDERFPDAEAVVRAWPQDVLTPEKLDAYSYVVVLSHDPKFDLPALIPALRSDARYIGAMGSRATHERRLTELRAQGFSDADLARIRAPIGLDLGGNRPEEIALAILAEMLAVRHGRDGVALSRSAEPIHDRQEAS